MVQDTPGFIPLVYVARSAPFIEDTYDAVYKILFLARLAEHCPAFVVESCYDLLESVDGVMSYINLEGLWDNSQVG